METEGEVPSVNHQNTGDMIIEEEGGVQEIATTKESTQAPIYSFFGTAEDQMREIMKSYYENLFPFELLEQWLRYGNDPNSKRADVDKTFFARREISFTLDNEAYLRNQYSHDWKELKAKCVKYRPQKIDIGAVFKASPKSSNFGFNDDEENPMQTCVEREFVIDIDMDDYNNVRTCCADANICGKCWKYMKEAYVVIERALKEYFGFRHIIWLFSGRRGVHAWVCDKRARQMTNEVRGSVAEHLRVVSGSDKSGIKAENLRYPIHHLARKSYEELRKSFTEIVIEDQRLFESESHVTKVLEFLRERFGVGDDGLRSIQKLISRSNAMESDTFFKKLEEEIEKIASTANLDSRRNKKKSYPMEELVLYFMYPRIDINVSKGMNHLLKSPFCVHPKSKKISVPLLDVKTFNPDTVPKIGDLITEREDGYLIVNEKPLKPYVDYFQMFVDNLEQETKKQQMADRAESRNEQGKNLDY